MAQRSIVLRVRSILHRKPKRLNASIVGMSFRLMLKTTKLVDVQVANESLYVRMIESERKIKIPFNNFEMNFILPLISPETFEA